ncbi:MAG TPA: AGE family epimerase/isomerase [Ruminococcus sp.]|nr:AGE family epimerase/isomerase [Ruminococcus sp.]
MRSAEDNSIDLLALKAKTVLDKQIVPFWTALKDPDFGGFYGQMDFDLTLQKTADKGVILQSRILWFFSELAMLTKSKKHIVAANHAFRFIAEHCFDDEFGGVYWSVTHDGKPSDTTKHTYAQSFALYALTSYYALSGNEKALDLSEQLLELIESRCRDNGGYLESFGREWKMSLNDKLSENNVIAERTMNTLLHVFEAYANLYRYQPTRSAAVSDAMTRILETFIGKVFSPEKRRLEVFFNRTYRSLVDLQSYGHDIETSWLLDDGCRLLDSFGLTEEISKMDGVLAESVYERAFAEKSLLNECESGKNDTDRIWWVQSEAVLGFINQWEKTGEEKYLAAAEDIFEYIQTYIRDDRTGSEWYWGVHADGSPMDEHGIVSDWKCPYHSGRMCFEIIRRSRI